MTIKSRIVSYLLFLVIGLSCCLYLSKWVFDPYLPIEGDAFGCWYDYARRLGSFQFAEAIKNADAHGRYPGYPIILAVIAKISGTDFLDTLRIGRILSICMTFFVLFGLFKIVLKHHYLSILSSLVFLTLPGVWANIGMNTQDSFKIAFFGLSLYSFLRLQQTQKYVWAILTIFSASFLALLRIVEVLPFFGFMITFYILNRSFQPHLLKWVCICSAVIISFLVSLHAWSYSVVGHFGFSSNGGAATVWLRLAREQTHNVLDFIRVVLTATINKTGYFIQDFSSIAAPISFRDTTSFVKTLSFGTDFSDQSVTMLGVLSMIWMTIVLFRKQHSSFSRSFAAAGLVSAGFYTFGLNHFEARYWLIVSVCLFAATLTAVNQSKFRNVVWPTLLLCFFVLHKGSDYRISMVRASDMAIMSHMKKWTDDLTDICSVSTLQAVRVPYTIYVWSSYRYWAKLACPRISVVFDEQAQNNGVSVLVLPEEFLLLKN